MRCTGGSRIKNSRLEYGDIRRRYVACRHERFGVQRPLNIKRNTLAFGHHNTQCVVDKNNAAVDQRAQCEREHKETVHPSAFVLYAQGNTELL